MPASLSVACLLLAVLAASGCAGGGALDERAKLDGPLRAQVEPLDARDATTIDVLVGIGADVPESARAQLEAAGLRVRTVAGDVVTATGTAAAIRRAARFDWVVRIEKSLERPGLRDL